MVEPAIIRYGTGAFIQGTPDGTAYLKPGEPFMVLNGTICKSVEMVNKNASAVIRREIEQTFEERFKPYSDMARELEKQTLNFTARGDAHKGYVVKAKTPGI